MDEEIYRVERDDYVGFLGQINSSMTDIEEEYLDDKHIIKVRSKKTGLILCARVIMEEEDYYYVYNMPLEEERIPPKQIRRITLKTREAVEQFFNTIGKLQKEKQNDRNIS